MKAIDQYAYHSPLRKFDPLQKSLFCFLILFTCLIAHSLFVFISVTILMGCLTIFKGRTSFRLYCTLLSIPLTFLILSLLTLLFDFSTDNTIFLWSIHIFYAYMGITITSINTCIFLFFKVLASISCLYFLCLSTPINDILRVFEKWHCPTLLIELMALIYRFIFVLIDIASTMYTAQVARLGYQGFRIGLRSFGILLSSLLVRTLKMNHALYTALECRGYTGSLQTLHEDYYQSFSYLYFFLIEGILIILIVIESILF
ncbi:cobalt ECF transporter T component CbiQ [Niameybacter sp.]|uniref:cobalt ECF transporter T component CbiQ n=1 Tax=Niameybacter sp. TaxID=2033640 RepID=UPI003FA60D38